MLKRILLLVLTAFVLFGCQPDKPLNKAKEITGFSFSSSTNAVLSADITGTINGTTITASVPFGTDITDLIATFTTTGISVKVNGAEQTSGTTVNDFTNALTYTVTAEDGSTKDYIVTVLIIVTREQLDQMIEAGEDVTKVDTSGITDMSSLFFNNSTFNQDISGWDVSNVTDMAGMFCYSTFNQDISGWDVSNVTDMGNLFQNNTAFNQDISRWDVSNVTLMSCMFLNASAFNKDISSWNVSNVTVMDEMFMGAAAFNQDISGWDVSSVTEMSSMFNNAASFNQNIRSWAALVAEDISYAGFSAGSCPLTPENHPYESWDIEE